MSEELLDCFRRIDATLRQFEGLTSGQISNAERRAVLDGLGTASSDYRHKIYKEDFSGRKGTLALSELEGFIEVALKHLEHAIHANKREDGLYHAYNLMTVEADGGVQITYLPEMLEGQVAVLERRIARRVRKFGRARRLEGQRPVPRRPVQLRVVPQQVVASVLGQEQHGPQGPRRLCPADQVGGGRQRRHCDARLPRWDTTSTATSTTSRPSAPPWLNLPASYDALVASDQKDVEAIYEGIFNHKAFTGRSGTFFGYEGLGSIYWHMVSKLRLAAFEVTKAAVESQSESSEVVGRLFDHYFEINAGIGAHKSPELYGAFPTDPYSHTPGGKGAQQPGMTGQVKEDLLCRFGELGVRVTDGCIHFDRALLQRRGVLEGSRDV